MFQEKNGDFSEYLFLLVSDTGKYGIECKADGERGHQGYYRCVRNGRCFGVTVIDNKLSGRYYKYFYGVRELSRNLFICFFADIQVVQKFFNSINKRHLCVCFRFCIHDAAP